MDVLRNTAGQRARECRPILTQFRTPSPEGRPLAAGRQSGTRASDTGRVISAARPDDISGIRDIEVAAGELFREIGMDAIADDPPLSAPELAPYLSDGRAWVATDAADNPIAYILVDVIDEWAHIEQVTVHPVHSRKGLGRSLIDHVERWAAAHNFQGMTLTTFRDVPWNAPYYERLGFVHVPEPAWSDGLRKLVQKENQHGLNAWPRVVMKRKIDHENPQAGG
ncbi:GNAT family N-acetyltransferase [Arthrobacter sp. S39]|nr:GNAT family N-acetyltransferase [Arthrobacter sp. S39]